VVAATYTQYKDAEIVSLCLEGDAHAWETLIHRYKRLIFSIATRFGFAPADASDIFQSICVQLIEHLHELKTGERLSSWLMTMTTRQCLRFRSIQTRDEDDGNLSVADPVDPKENLEAIRLRVEREQMLRRCVDDLPDRCRGLIRLLYFVSPLPTYEEIASKLEIPVSSVGPNRARCIEKLREIVLARHVE
jgi:RNA polymerase sigma factor (sigma-70 family)